MNWFWKKKKEKDEKIITPEITHQCVFKDLPWYMTTYYSEANRTAGYEIKEPYVCVFCGSRRDVLLEERHWEGITPEQREKFYQKVRSKYKKYLKPRAVVEDMINNILLVKDVDYLNMVEEMRGLPHINVGTSAEMKQAKDTDFKINLSK